MIKNFWLNVRTYIGNIDKRLAAFLLLFIIRIIGYNKMFELDTIFPINIRTVLNLYVVYIAVMYGMLLWYLWGKIKYNSLKTFITMLLIFIVYIQYALFQPSSDISISMELATGILYGYLLIMFGSFIWYIFHRVKRGALKILGIVLVVLVMLSWCYMINPWIFM